MLHQNDLGIDKMYRYTYFINFDILVANNRAQDIWAFSAPAPEPNFNPAGMTAPAPSSVHNFLKVFYAYEREFEKNPSHISTCIAHDNNNRSSIVVGRL